MLQGKAPIVYGDGTYLAILEQNTNFFTLFWIAALRTLIVIWKVFWVIKAFEKILLRDDLDGEVINVGPDKEFISINELVSILNNILGTNWIYQVAFSFYLMNNMPYELP